MLLPPLSFWKRKLGKEKVIRKKDGFFVYRGVGSDVAAETVDKVGTDLEEKRERRKVPRRRV